MEETMQIENKVKQSKLETVDLEKLFLNEPVMELDLEPFLFKGLILKEKEFREGIENFDWTPYEDAWVGIYCSSDAIIPHWAWMLLSAILGDRVRGLFHGSGEDLREQILLHRIEQKDWSEYEGGFVLLKGCSDMTLPPAVYVRATEKLRPYVQKLMYGEACSNVPVYRKPRR